MLSFLREREREYDRFEIARLRFIVPWCVLTASLHTGSHEHESATAYICQLTRQCMSINAISLRTLRSLITPGDEKANGCCLLAQPFMTILWTT